MNADARNKQVLRRHFRALRQQRDDGTIRSGVLELLLPSTGTGHFRPEAGRLGLYWPLPGEPDLMPLLPTLQGWKLALPCSDGQGGLSYRAWDGRPLEGRDGCGIPAPVDQPLLEPPQLQLLLVPALAVDERGVRLGYGGGYYDRLRAKPEWADLPAWVVLPQACLSHALLPKDPWDKPFSGWITEEGPGPNGH